LIDKNDAGKLVTTAKGVLDASDTVTSVPEFAAVLMEK
jgi:hypothetical protein